MSIINELHFYTPSSKGTILDPINHRRSVFVTSLRKQILMIDDENVKGRRWWKEVDGGLVSTLRYSTTPLTLSNGSHFPVSDKETLKSVYEKLIVEVQNGDFDEILESHWNKSPFNRENRIEL